MSDTAAKLLSAAASKFAAEGYGATSLAAIATAAGTTKQVLLHHYRSKADLYVSVLREVEIRLAAAVTEAQAACVQPADQLEYVLLSLLAPQNEELVRLTLHALMAAPSVHNPTRRWPLRPFLESLRTMAKDAATGPTDDDRAFAAVYGLIGGVSYYLISRDTLTGMYGKRGHDLLARGFKQDVKARLASL